MIGSAKRRAAAVMAVVGALFVALAAATGSHPSWVAAAAINFIGAADSLRHHYRTAPFAPAPDPCLVRVGCPHCGAAFAIDPGVETLANLPPGGTLPPGGPMVFRPACPACRQRVAVRA